MTLDIFNVLQKSFQQTLDKKNMLNLLFYIIVSICNLVAILLVGIAFLGPVFLQSFLGTQIGQSNLVNPDIPTNFINGLILSMAILFFVIIPIQTYFVLAIQFLATKRGLELNNMNSSSFSITKPIKLFVLGVLQFFLAYFSIYSKRLIIVVGFFYLSLIITIALAVTLNPLSLVFLLITILLVLAYIPVIIYNAVKLSLSAPILIEGNTGIIEATKKSFELSHGHTTRVFLAILALTTIVFITGIIVIILGLILGIIPVIGTIIFYIIQFIFAGVFFIAVQLLTTNIYASLSGKASSPQTVFSQTTMPETQPPKWLAKK